jgi:SAM-dependent methyltransferase
MSAGMTIDYFSLGQPLNRIRSYFAVKARNRMFQRFMAVMGPTERSQVLDLGVTPERSLPESNIFETLYPYKSMLTAASIEDASFLTQLHPGLTFVQVPAGHLPFADQAFDIVFCSAVLEHVGDSEAQHSFIAECLRVARHFFFTTPDRRFPIEMHTLLPLLHWLPQPRHQVILRAFGKDFWAQTENLNLLTPTELRSLFPPCSQLTIESHRLLGWPSNIMAYGSKR